MGGEDGNEARAHIVQKFMRMFSAFSLFMLFKPRALPEDQPLESDLLHPDPTCCGWT